MEKQNFLSLWTEDGHTILDALLFSFRQHEMKEDVFKCYSKMAGEADQENVLESIRLLFTPLTLPTWKVISSSANKR